MKKINIDTPILTAMIATEADTVSMFVQSGFKDGEDKPMWLYFEQDAYGLEPWVSGIKLLSVKQISSMFNFDIEFEYKNQQEKTKNQING